MARIVGIICQATMSEEQEVEKCLRRLNIVNETDYPLCKKESDGIGQGCQTHCQRGPHQPHGCLQRAECNFSINVTTP